MNVHRVPLYPDLLTFEFGLRLSVFRRDFFRREIVAPTAVRRTDGEADLRNRLSRLPLPFPGSTNRGGRLTTADLLIKVTCFVKKVNNTFNINRN